LVYADYTFYKQDFYGSVIPDEFSFNSHIMRADAFLNRLTFGKIIEISDEVKCAACAVAEVYYNCGSRAGISSENNDGYSVSYITDEAALGKQLYDAAKLFLPSGLLYSGTD